MRLLSADFYQLSLAPPTDNFQLDDLEDGDRSGDLALVEPSVRDPGVPDPQDVLVGAWRVQGWEPRVLDVGEVVEAQDHRDRIAVSEPRHLERKIIGLGELYTHCVKAMPKL